MRASSDGGRGGPRTGRARKHPPPARYFRHNRSYFRPRKTNHRGTEDTEEEHREEKSSFFSVFFLCVLCASVVRFSWFLTPAGETCGESPSIARGRREYSAVS